jgi:hypothetical protein
MAFARNLSEKMVAALNEEYTKEAGWWRVLADHKDTIIAIRNNSLNVYRNGCNIAKVEQHTNGSLTISVHYKFLLKKKLIQPYILCGNGSPEIADPGSVFISSLRDIDDIVYWTETLGGLEKTGVHRVILANTNVADTEIALPGDQTDENDVPSTLDKSKSSRIDFCAVQPEGSRLWLRFFEAKHYSYASALRASDELVPKVIGQLLRYRQKLGAQRTSIEDAYRKSIVLAHKLHGRNVLGKNTNPLNLQRLQVDPVPRLVVFGFDADQKKGAKFKEHMDKLRKTLKKETGVDCLLLKGSPNEFAVGISK